MMHIILTRNHVPPHPSHLIMMQTGTAARHIPVALQAAVCAKKHRGLRHTVIPATMPTQACPIHIKPW